MTRWRRLGTILALSLGTGSGAALFGGCSGDDSGSRLPVPDAGVADASADAAHVDANASTESGSDGSTLSDASDATVAADASPDAALDTTVPDGSTDGSNDGATDASVEDTRLDAAADGSSDGSSEASSVLSALEAFPSQVATAICQQFATCCFGSADAGQFDMPLCLSQVLPTGFHGTTVGAFAVVDSGLLTFDSTHAQACLQDIATIGCTVTAAQSLAATNDCYAAISGTLASGSPCTQPIVCAGSQYCRLPGDGGTTGVCTPLSGDGGSCDYGTFGVSEYVCSPRSSGIGGLRCVNEDTATPYELFDASTWTCGPTLGVDAACNYGIDCVTQICDTSNYLCAGSSPYADPETCAYYTIDAGVASH